AGRLVGRRLGGARRAHRRRRPQRRLQGRPHRPGGGVHRPGGACLARGPQGRGAARGRTRRRRGRGAVPPAGADALSAPRPALAGWSVVVWVVRDVRIVAADHSAGFKAVHTVLAVVSIALAALAWREARRAAAPPAGAPAGDGVAAPSRPPVPTP